MKIIKKIKFKISADGSSASGKTTASKLIAKKFKMRFLSSGILYRFCALKTIENNNKYNDYQQYSWYFVDYPKIFRCFCINTHLKIFYKN